MPMHGRQTATGSRRAGKIQQYRSGMLSAAAIPLFMEAIPNGSGRLAGSRTDNLLPPAAAIARYRSGMLNREVKIGRIQATPAMFMLSPGLLMARASLRAGAIIRYRSGT